MTYFLCLLLFFNNNICLTLPSEIQSRHASEFKVLHRDRDHYIIKEKGENPKHFMRLSIPLHRIIVDGKEDLKEILPKLFRRVLFLYAGKNYSKSPGDYFSYLVAFNLNPEKLDCFCDDVNIAAKEMAAFLFEDDNPENSFPEDLYKKFESELDEIDFQDAEFACCKSCYDKTCNSLEVLYRDQTMKQNPGMIIDVNNSNYSLLKITRSCCTMMNLISGNTTFPGLHLLLTVLGLEKNIIKVLHYEYAEYYFECLDINRLFPQTLEFLSRHVGDFFNFHEILDFIKQSKSKTPTAK